MDAEVIKRSLIIANTLYDYAIGIDPYADCYYSKEEEIASNMEVLLDCSSGQLEYLEDLMNVLTGEDDKDGCRLIAFEADNEEADLMAASKVAEKILSLVGTKTDAAALKRQELIHTYNLTGFTPDQLRYLDSTLDFFIDNQDVEDDDEE